MSFHQNTQKWRLNIWNINGKVLGSDITSLSKPVFYKVNMLHKISSNFLLCVCAKESALFFKSGLTKLIHCLLYEISQIFFFFTQILAAGDNKYLLNDHRFAAHQCGGEPSSGGWLCHLSSLQLVMNEECPWGGQFKHEFCTVFLRFQGFAPHSQED